MPEVDRTCRFILGRYGWVPIPEADRACHFLGRYTWAPKEDERERTTNNKQQQTYSARWRHPNRAVGAMHMRHHPQGEREGTTK